jgi:hypothetical protein
MTAETTGNSQGTRAKVLTTELISVFNVGAKAILRVSAGKYGRIKENRM